MCGLPSQEHASTYTCTPTIGTRHSTGPLEEDSAATSLLL